MFRLWIRSNEDQDFESLSAIILYPVFLASRRYRSLTGTKHLPLPSHLKAPLPFQHDVHFVLLVMHVPFLFLPRLEAVDIAEESGRLKDIVFLHLLITKLLKIR